MRAVGCGLGRLGAALGLAGEFHATGEEAGFDEDHAAETPFGGGRVAEAGLLGCVGRAKGVGETVEEGLEGGGVLYRENAVAGTETVGAAVTGDFGFARGGTGAC